MAKAQSSPKQLYRWKKQITKDDSRNNKLKQIAKKTSENFIEA